MHFNSKKFTEIFSEEYYKINTIVKVSKHFGFTDDEIENILDYLEFGKISENYTNKKLEKIQILKVIFEFNQKNVQYFI